MSINGDDSKRQRVSRACDLCRRKKVKCDGLIPVCSNCQQFSYLCTYKDTTKKRGPPKGYIEAIETRLNRMEALLGDVAASDTMFARAAAAELNTPLETPQGETINSRPVRRSSSKADMNGHHHSSSWSSTATNDREGHYRQRSSSSPGQRENELPPPTSLLLYDDPTAASNASSSSKERASRDPVGQLSMDESGQMRYIGKSSGLYMIPKLKPLQNGAYFIPRRSYQQRNESEMSVDRQRMLDPFELPPPDLSDHLIGLYFEHFYPFLPLLHKDKFLATINGTKGTPPVPPILLNAIYAVASRVSNDPRVRSDPSLAGTAGDIFFERARILLEAEHDVSKISTIQALLLMSSHQHGAMRSTRAWLYNGMAFRFASDIGLNRNCDEWNIPDDVKEERKRVFWCCFVIDRITSATYGRTFTIDEADCDISLPDVPDGSAGLVNGSAVIDQFQHLIQIIKILGYIIQNTYYVKARESAFSQNMNGVINTLEKKLSTWLESLPPELQSQSNHATGTSASVAKCQLHMFYHAAVVLLYRPMIPAAKQSNDSHQSPSWVRCSAAADAIVDIAQGMFETGKLRYVHNYLIYAIFTGAIIFVHNASSVMDREIVQDSKNRIHMIMKFLSVIERTWNTAARSSSILGGLLGVRDIDLEQRPPQYKAEDLTSQDESFALKSGPSTSFERHRGSPQQWLQRKQSANGGGNDLKAVEQMQGTTEPYGAKHPSDASQRPPPPGHVYDHPVEANASGYSYSPAQSQMGLGQPMEAGTSTMDPFAAPGTVLGPKMYRQPNNHSPMGPGSHQPALPHMPPKSLPGVDNMTVPPPPKLPPVPANSSLFNYYNNDLPKGPGYQRQDNNNTNTSNMMYW
ncbi:hypothetical protein K450DRAFT_238703 [Umbelopsis ramanniana AG]|uniref:Zn(2)-C6 fungal-type domain-containing protein n=1 Tax=Umbelopsis ramanniana AG TaxID=1314678 RepID=A0AAD5EA48_UMBRA|nr:uncharacterized protein K450DRAFT_238703 [Umbelopsis ramanniana AG]KAI8580213.1 hypothetical protein K450DRAFT_238703 [Umbelopsis ramanniana AG]